MSTSDTYIISNFISSMSICPLQTSSYTINPITGGSNSDFVSNDGVTYVTTSSTGTSSQIVVDVPTITIVVKSFIFIISATAEGGGSQNTADIYIKYKDCIYGIDFSGMSLTPDPALLYLKEVSDTNPLALTFSGIVVTSPIECSIT